MKRILLITLPLLLCGIFLPSKKVNSQNLLFDGDFSTTTSLTPYFTDPPPLYTWSSWGNDATGASFSANIQNGICSYAIANAGTNMYDVQLAQWGFQLTSNHRYRLSFDVKADAERDFGVFIGENGGSWTNFNPSYLRHATTDWQTITIDIDVPVIFALHKLSFEMGIQNIGMSFAHISLVELGEIPLDKVVIASNFEHALGCSDWDPNCDQTALTYNSSTGLWTGTFNIPAGCYQYKVPINGNWNINYGENGILGGANINLYLSEDAAITFTYDPSTHIVQTSPVASGFSTNCLPQVVLTGSFQTALGCGADWDANCQNTALSFNSVTGKFEGDFNIPSGYYEYRAILNGDWGGNNFGNGGVPGGNPYSIYICEGPVHFTYDPVTHIVTNNLDAQPNTVVLAGSFQSELGCTSDWQPDCDNTRLTYDPNYGAWVGTFDIPAGHWEYKITLNNSWDVNYGQYGTRDGDNITLDLCSPARVTFTYRHSNCYHSIYTDVVVSQPKSVVIAGSFQSELGCASDWQADCNNTRMTFDPNNGIWSDTLLIPAGHWEYKWTINDSWDENYGLYGERNGPAISLDLCTPSRVVFNLYYYNCSAFGYAYSITNGVCLTKFYDANVNGYPDPGEEPMGGVTFTLTGNGITQTQTTGSDGKTSFSGLPDGMYVVKEKVPSGYFSSTTDSQYVFLYGNMANTYFGNVCTGAGGAKGLGFWTSKNGEAALTQTGTIEYTLAQLRNLSLRNADGTEFDPYTYAQLSTYLKGANAKNMVYMLSAELATMLLNTWMGYVDPYNSYIYTPGCSWWGNFTSVDNLMWQTNYYLYYKTTVDGKDPDRGYLECLKTAFDNGNNNLTFVQPHPCGATTTSIDRRALQESIENHASTVKIWPNPSNNYFTLRPADYSNKDAVELKVYNINGQQVFRASGFSNKDFRFGEELIPGIYMVEFIQGNNKSTFKVVKQ